MVKLEQEKPRRRRGFDSCKFYLAGCLARGVTDVLSTWSQEDWDRKGKLVSYFLFFFRDLEVSFSLS